MTHIHRCIIFITASLLNPANTLAEKNNIGEKIKVPFSATMKSYNKFSPKKVHKSKITMSKHGVRVESNDMFIDNNKGLYIQNFSEKKSWVIDKKKRIFSNIEINDEENLTSKGQGSNVGGIMSTRPCLGYNKSQKKIIGQETLSNDEKNIIWSCSNIKNQTIKQGYSQKWNIVVWEESANGNTSKLVNIKKSHYKNDFFLPSSNFREVSLKEFYTGGTTTLEKYK